MSADSSDTRARFAQATEITTATYDRVARNYAERNEKRGRHWSERMEQFVDMLADNDARQPIPDLGRPGDDATLEEYLQFVPVLDAGCGPGRDARALAEYDLPVLGIDISQGMLDEAGERTARRLSHGFIRYALMDMRRLDLPDASCRGVWCSASLLHLPLRTAPRAMRELVRVTRPGGPLAIFLKLRAADAEAERLQTYEHVAGEQGQRFFAYYTADEARALVETAGAEIVDLAAIPGTRPSDTPGWVTLLARKPV
ncbi:MAG: class I SAM-dependent methyltransferase [Nitrososphaerota archaeon]